MSRSKTPEHLLSDEQRKRRARNERYRYSKLDSIETENKETSQPILRLISKSEMKYATIRDASNETIRTKDQPTLQPSQSETATITNQDPPIKSTLLPSGWRNFKNLYASPALFFSTLTILAMTALLTSFQAGVYIKEGLGLTSWPIALVCEISLVMMAVFFALNQNRKIAAALFMGMFCYCLGTMSYDLKSSQASEVVSRDGSKEKNELLAQSLKGAQAALSVAIKKSESGNIAKHTKTVEELSHMILNRTVPSLVNGLITYKYDGLIFLRALLMLINAFLIHFVVKETIGKGSKSQQRGG